MTHPPERIVCLTEETVETLYLLGEDRRIVGVSGYAVRPPRVRREKPRISAFISADVPKILALEPDLILAFSDLQADIVAALIREGVAVHAFNQRSITGILDMVRMLAAMVGVPAKGEQLASKLAVSTIALFDGASVTAIDGRDERKCPHPGRSSVPSCSGPSRPSLRRPKWAGLDRPCARRRMEWAAGMKEGRGGSAPRGLNQGSWMKEVGEQQSLRHSRSHSHSRTL